jgi:multiple sugar transport system permease protein
LKKLPNLSSDGKSRTPMQVFPYVLIAPTVILTVCIMFLPILRVFYLSFQNYNYRKSYLDGFIGFANYVKMFTTDATFKTACWVTLKWVFWEVSLQLIFGMILALLLNREFRFRGFVRAIAFVPWAVSGVLTTMLWLLMYNEHIGIINYVFEAAGLIKNAVGWTANTSTVLGAVIVAELWRGIPFFAITLLASLQSISPDLYEAASIDGCGRVKSFLHITLPHLKDTIVLTTLMRCIWEFNSVDLIYNMTNGGPMNLTTTLSVYMMKTAVVNSDYGYASTIGVFCFSLLLIFSAVYLKITKYGKVGMNK